jgi:hypothetical protein
MLETDLVKLLAQRRGKGKYDCLCMCSGGKDSTAAPYYMTKRYKLNVLAFMFDHGFETEGAVANVKRAVERLGVDFLPVRSTEMHPLFAEILREHPEVVICHACAIWYMGLTFKTAERLGIPIIVGGWTLGQSSRREESQPEFAKMSAATKAFLSGRFLDLPSSMAEVVERARTRSDTLVLSPHWFLPFGAESYVETIQRELGWERAALSYPAGTTNCRLNFLSVRNSMEHYGYTHYHVEMSRMIREGLMTRAEALDALRINFDEGFLDEIASSLANRAHETGC